MATKYTATIKFECWKQHVCAACGCAFRYRFQRTVSAESYYKEKAEREARKAAEDALAADVDPRPCPSCGLYQPDMVGAGRAYRHGLLALFFAASVVLLVILCYFDLLAPHVVTWLAAATALAALLLHLRFALWDPNRDRDANRARADASLESGELELLRAGRPEGAAVPDCGPARGHAVALALLALGVLAVAAPELMRLALGWPLNREWTPAVVGLGDEATFAFGDRVSSIKGLWHGGGDVELLNADELGVADPGLRFVTGEDRWGESASLLNQDELKTWHPWVRVRVPRNPAVGGKEMRLRIALKATYPAGYKFLRYDNQERAFTETVALRPAAAEGAAGVYREVWWLGLLGGAVWLAAVGAGLRRLAQELRAKALPTMVVPINDEPV
jgi:hypothetical protein